MELCNVMELYVFRTNFLLTDFTEASSVHDTTGMSKHRLQKSHINAYYLEWVTSPQFHHGNSCLLLCTIVLVYSNKKTTVVVELWACNPIIQFPPLPAICRHVDTDRSSYATTGPWRSCVSSCGCPCLPSSVRLRDVQSLATFRQQLKTVLFRTSFSEDADT